MKTIENWSVGPAPSSPYMAPELVRTVVTGKIYGCSRWEDGSPIRTSYITEVDKENQTVTTHNGSVYRLGSVDPNYEKAYPNARQRIFK